MHTCLAKLTAKDAYASMRAGIDQRAIALHAIVSKEGLLEDVLFDLGFLDGTVAEDGPGALSRMADLLPSLFLNEASRVAELSRSDVLLALFDQLRFVTKFVLSDEGTIQDNIHAVEQLVQQGRVGLFLP